MRISHRHHFVFFAFPKTGSESVRHLLDPISDVRGRPENALKHVPSFKLAIPNHATPAMVKAVFTSKGWDFDSYFRFVMVRNPWQRLVSLYRMLQVQLPLFSTPVSDWLLHSRPDGVGGVPAAYAPRLWARYGTYALDNYACDEAGTRLVSAVFRLEDIDRLPHELRQRGIPVPPGPVPVTNAKPPVDLDAFYCTPALKAVVAQRYAKDIEEFGYSYGD